MVEWCCVKGCANNTGKTKNRNVRFFRFPAWKRTFGPQMEDITRRRRLAWVAAVRRKDITFNHIAAHMRVCSLHFHKGQPAYEMMETDPDWVPSLCLGDINGEPSDSDSSESSIHWELLKDDDEEEEEEERVVHWEDDEACGLYDEERGQPSYEMFETHPDWAPSLNLGHTEVKPSNQERYNRRKRRRLQEDTPIPPDWPSIENMPIQEETELDQFPMVAEITPKEEDIETVIVGGAQNLVEKTPIVDCQNCVPKIAELKRLKEENQALKSDRMNECDFCAKRRSEINRLMDENRALKTELEKWKFEEQFLKGDNEKVKYYTGLPGFEALMTLLNIIAPFLPQNCKGISNFQMFFLTLIRLRLNLPIQHIFHLFRKERRVVMNVFSDTISSLNAYCSHLFQWPSREEIQASLPQKFTEEFDGCVALLLDCFELKLSSPSQHRNIKYLMSLTPKGTVTFVSKGFEGSVRNEHMIEKSGILDKLLPGDYILVADQCFVLEKNDGGSTNRLKVLHKNAAVAKMFSRQKVHVKRMTNNVRNKYTILSAPVLPTMLHQFEGEDVTFLDKVVKVCCALTNVPDTTETSTTEKVW